MLVLIAEDEPSVQAMEKAYLEHAGYKVAVAASCKETLDQWQAYHPDIIILDLNLSDGDGITVCEKIRRTSAVPIIITTARVEEIDELKGLDIGADDYLKKPFSTAVLLAHVTSILRRNQQGTVHLGTLHLDPLRQIAYENDVELVLSSLQFKLLFLLSSQPGRIFSRQEILKHLELDGTVYDRTIDAHIKSIRQKLSNRGIIRTVYGSGYAFQPYEI